MNDRMQIDTNSLEQIRRLIRPACHKAAARYFDDSTVYGDELAAAIEDEIIEAYQSHPTREQVLASVKDCGHLTSVGRIRAMIDGVPDDRTVITQLVGQQSGVWNVFLTGAILNNGDGMVVMSTGHPDLDHLPGGETPTNATKPSMR